MSNTEDIEMKEIHQSKSASHETRSKYLNELIKLEQEYVDSFQNIIDTNATYFP
jgi:hypothetical protein